MGTVENIETDWDKVREWLEREKVGETGGVAYGGRSIPRTEGTQQVMDKSSKRLSQKQEVAEEGMETLEEEGEEVQGGKEGVSRRKQEGQKRDVDTMGRRREVRMGHSESREEPLQPEANVHQGRRRRREYAQGERRHGSSLRQTQDHYGGEGRGGRKGRGRGIKGSNKEKKPSDMAMRRVRKALSKTKNKSAAGPDGISWGLLKMIKATALGQAVLEDIASPGEQVGVPVTAGEMIMVMIPKLGRDHKKVKGWRPIVLANTVGKLGEKLIAEDLQDIEEL